MYMCVHEYVCTYVICIFIAERISLGAQQVFLERQEEMYIKRAPKVAQLVTVP